MRRFFFVLALAAAALAMGMGASSAIADDANATDATVDYEVEFGDDLRITDYDLEDGHARITFDADRSRTVTISDALAGVDQEGAVEVPSETHRLTRGETTISMDVRELRGASTVGVSVGDQTARLSTEMSHDETTETNPFETFGGESGLFWGIGMTTGLATIGAAYVVRSEDSGVIEA